MILTADTPVSPRPVTVEQFEVWAKREVTPLLRDLRGFANQREHVQKTITTAATGALTTIWSEELPDNSSFYVKAHVVARATAGGVARAAYEKAGLFYSEGALTQEGATATLFSVSSVAGFFTAFVISGQTLQLQVLDDAIRTVKWNAVVVIQEVR